MFFIRILVNQRNLAIGDKMVTLFTNLETGSWLKPQGKSREPRDHQTSKEVAFYGLYH